jgi:hypothetical protein
MRSSQYAINLMRFRTPYQDRTRQQFLSAAKLTAEPALDFHPAGSCPGRGRAGRRRYQGGVNGDAPFLSRAYTHPISTKCTARNQNPIVPAVLARENPPSTKWDRALKARSSSRPTRANRDPNSDPRHAPAAAHRDIAAGGRSGSGRCQTSAS